MRSKPFAPRGAFLSSDPPAPAGCTCRRLRRGWARNPRCPKHGDPLAAPTPPIPLWCKQCGRTWTQTIALPLPIDDAVRRLKAITRIGCPHCGANGLNVLLDTRPAGAKVDATTRGTVLATELATQLATEPDRTGRRSS